MPTLPVQRTHAVARAARVLLIPYLIFLGLTVWLPGQQAENVTGVVTAVAEAVAEAGVTTFHSSYTLLEFLANIALFVPFGVLLALAWPGLRTARIALLGLGTSALIEFVQLFLPTRFSMLSDLIANSAGAAIGSVSVSLIVRAALVRNSMKRTGSSALL